MYFYDTETCGFYGMALLIQYAKDEGEIKLHDVWSEEIGKTLDLIEDLMDEGVCGYHLAFDHFHLSKLYTTFSLLPRDKKPESIVHDVYLAEAEGRFGQCIKPRSAVDLMMHVRKSQFQQGMSKRVFKVMKVHKSIAAALCRYLNRVEFPHYMHVSKSPIWEIKYIKDKKDKDIIDSEFRNIVGTLRPSTGLKTICTDVFKLPATHFQEVMPDSQPVELGYIPWAKGIVDLPEWPTKEPPPGYNLEYCGTWPIHIQIHKIHWKMKKPRKYAMEDVEWTRKLYHYFEDPEETYDSALTCAVASCRWRGYELDIPKIKERRASCLEKVNKTIIDPRRAKRYIMEVMDDYELDKFQDEKNDLDSTNALTLGVVSKWVTPCAECIEKMQEEFTVVSCEKCQPTPAALRARDVIESRKWKSKALTYGKLMLGGRFHPSFSIIGTKSSRMSGADKFNPQGIDSSDEMRECFTLGKTLMGGDFSGFELTIADAVYEDPNWHDMLLNDRKVHADFGADLYESDYDTILNDQPRYRKSKSGIFLLLYGGEAYGMSKKLDVTEEQAAKAEQGFFKRFPPILKRRKEIYKDYMPLREGVWHEPKDSIGSLFGHKRYYGLEFQICKLFYDIASNPPVRSDDICIRSEKKGTQNVVDALRSAFTAAIHVIQKKAARSAINHEIQSPGACITKMVQKAIWDLQPAGVHDWVAQPSNIHDEIFAVVTPGYEDKVREAVYKKVEELQEIVPLLKITWGAGLNWKDIH